MAVIKGVTKKKKFFKSDRHRKLTYYYTFTFKYCVCVTICCIMWDTNF